MAKKIRFPLEMKDGIEVRSIDELQDHFSISKILDYLQDGKLVTWLRDRYEDDIADSVESLDLQDPELMKNICDIFDVSYEKVSAELAHDLERKKRIARLRTYVADGNYENVIDQIAFDQDELYDLLDENITTIYLCGEKFSIPLAKQYVTYIGINHPMVVIRSKVEVAWEKKHICVENVVFDSKYQEVLDCMNKTDVMAYTDQTYLNFMIPIVEKDQIKRMCQIANKNLNYDIDCDIKNLKDLIRKNNVIGLAENYLEQL